MAMARTRMNGSGGAAIKRRVPSHAPTAAPASSGQKSRRMRATPPPRRAEISTSARVSGAMRAMADLMSTTSATSGVATIGKPKPIAPWAKPENRQASTTKPSAQPPSSRLIGEQLGQVQRRAGRQRLDLLAAGEAARHHDALGRAGQGGQQRKRGDALGGVVELRAITEGAGHAAAAGVGRHDLAARILEDAQ